MNDMTTRLDQVLERSAPIANDGMVICRGCLNRYVLIGYCADCQRLDKMLEERHASRLSYLAQVEGDRVDMGIEPFDVMDPEVFPSLQALVGIFVGLLLVLVCVFMGAWHLGFGAWHLMKSAISWLLQVSAG